MEIIGTSVGLYPLKDMDNRLEMGLCIIFEIPVQTLRLSLHQQEVKKRLDKYFGSA